MKLCGLTALVLGIVLAAAPAGRADAVRGGGHGKAGRTSPPKAGARGDDALRARVLDAKSSPFLDTLEERTFHYFWDLSDSTTGLTPDRWPTHSFVSVGAMGFALTAYPIGVERGYITRAQAIRRVHNTLHFMWNARQDTASAGSTGYQGFFYHFLDPATGKRFEKVELSTMDTGLFLAGALFCQSYFNRPDAAEAEIRAQAESLYARADFNWAQPRPPTICHGWTPEAGFLPYDWRGYNETMILHVLALGSPTHPVGPATWKEWTANYKWGTFEGYEQLGFAPLFGHQYSLVWLDLKGIRDDFMQSRKSDYFENSRRATLSQWEYAKRNPGHWTGYGIGLWGLTACDGPVDRKLKVDGVEREFHTYWARGASFTHINDDGTIAPAAAGGSIPFEPAATISTLMHMRQTYGDQLFSQYGFVDAFNPTLDVSRIDPGVRDVGVHQGRMEPGRGWFDIDYLGIDEGPILAMAENYRTGLIWKVMRRNPHIVRGLRQAGFSGGWLDHAAEKP